jgi:hypothetical protein
MRKKTRICICLALSLVVTALAACQAKAPKPSLAESPLSDIDWDDREVFRQGLIAAERDALDRLPGASVYHIDFQIPDDFERIKGHQEVRYTNQEDVPLAEVYFRLFPNVSEGSSTVSAVRVDGEDVEPVYEFERSAVRVPLPTPLRPGEQAVIGMDFEIQVAKEMGGNYGLFGYFEDVLVLDEFYPVIAVYDDEGWNVEVPHPNGDRTYLDASLYLVRVIAPADLVIVASGVEVSREEAGSEQVLTIAAGPARTFYLAANESFAVVSEKLGETTVNSYAVSGGAEMAEVALGTAVRALESYSERFGTYPYTEFDVASTPMLALGIEYPGMTGITLSVYDPNAEVAGLPSRVLIESVVAHEVAHQWFYNGVGSDQVDEPWLDEALAQYLTWLYYVDAYGRSAAQGYRVSWDDRWGRADMAEIPIGLSTADYGEEYSAIVYGRGPIFVEALANEMGQETFDAFLRDYYQSHKWDIGTGESFRQLAEEHCQCDLSELFEAWVY